ncbi:hypothetical protein [Algicola sagamiensis]|uniref:hypothetical protein n=1 Tax=Algicola sagamiensis TaxID=163869 RepID=UPI00037182E9|nr:hypothetical protein [Algicola sagamiensis]
MQKAIPITNGKINGKLFPLVIEAGKHDIIHKTLFSTNKKINRIATENAQQLYRDMLAGGRQCRMNIVILEPLTAEKADDLNHKRYQVAFGAGSAVTGAVSKAPLPFGANFVAGVGAGALTKKVILNNLPRSHAGDVHITLDAFISGGIGPQRTTKTISVQRTEYE